MSGADSYEKHTVITGVLGRMLPPFQCGMARALRPSEQVHGLIPCHILQAPE